MGYTSKLGCKMALEKLGWGMGTLRMGDNFAARGFLAVLIFLDE